MIGIELCNYQNGIVLLHFVPLVPCSIILGSVAHRACRGFIYGQKNDWKLFIAIASLYQVDMAAKSILMHNPYRVIFSTANITKPY